MPAETSGLSDLRPEAVQIPKYQIPVSGNHKGNDHNNLNHSTQLPGLRTSHLSPNVTRIMLMLAGFTTEEAEADTVADQGLKRVNRIFGGLNEGIWPKTEELTA
ncbi:hypothetical protein F511_33066 [Dorcoceras hygrometricum]|uniref:Uncharacterized protein n=1 Tax=Dorcoceras hygrometricum TaxID=472368 RepID=A0A2Z7C4N3_9LAMI|nr:hypothetical protein F511_33066 [Dorcoceras hygrometricum]